MNYNIKCLWNQEKKCMRIGIRTLRLLQFYLRKVQSYISYQLFYNFTNSLGGKYVNLLLAKPLSRWLKSFLSNARYFTILKCQKYDHNLVF